MDKNKLRNHMTVREEFAARAMQGLLATISSNAFMTEKAANHIAKEAVMAADALIAELSRTETTANTN